MSPSNGSSSGGGVGHSNSKNYIEHQVSKMDTLAGVAIKYGVEVADIKRLNGLATDLQMFALKSLLIPLPGRHPPSPNLSNGSTSPRENGIDKTPLRLGQSNMLESFQPQRMKTTQQKVSPAMSTLQKYYGLKSPKPKGATEGTEMAVYRLGTSDCSHDGLLPKASPVLDYSSNGLQPRKLSNGFMPQNGEVSLYAPLLDAGDGESERSNEKSVRRRQKADVDSWNGTPEKLLKEENGGGSSDFSPVTGKNLAMRTKSGSRTSLPTDSESGWLNPIPVGLGDSIITDTGVRKSSSTPSLQDPENSISSLSVWPTSKWSLKPDLQTLSTAAITRPIFDGLPKPITGRWSKAALD